MAPVIGGQALMEGVLMKGKDFIATAVYTPNRVLIIEKKPYEGWSKKFPILKWPFIRGSVTLIEMMIIGMKALLYSAQVSSPEDEKPSDNELGISLVISLMVSILVFVVIPASFFTWVRTHSTLPLITLNLLEGLFRLTMVIGFISSTLLSKDMRRVYQYHGAEHKAVNAYEHNDPLTLASVKKYSTIHTRCGTSYIMVVLIVSILIFSLIGRQGLLMRIVLKLLLFPVVSGIAYEIIRFAANHPKNWLLKLFLLPGLGMQLITTKEPDDEQLMAAISALKEVV